MIGNYVQDTECVANRRWLTPLLSQYRLRTIPGTGDLEHKAAGLTHYFLYGFMTIMPASGIAMGYFGEFQTQNRFLKLECPFRNQKDLELH